MAIDDAAGTDSGIVENDVLQSIGYKIVGDNIDRILEPVFSELTIKLNQIIIFILLPQKIELIFPTYLNRFHMTLG